MTNVALDTNIWIYLAKDELYELWLKFKEMKETKQINVIVNDVIIREWKRNKQTAIKKLAESIQNEYKSAQQLSNYLSGDEQKQYLKAISLYKNEENRIKKATQRVEEIESFINSCQLISCNSHYLI